MKRDKLIKELLKLPKDAVFVVETPPWGATYPVQYIRKVDKKSKHRKHQNNEYLIDHGVPVI